MECGGGGGGVGGGGGALGGFVKSELSRHRNATSLTSNSLSTRFPENIRDVRDFWPRDATHNQGGPLTSECLVNHSDASQPDPRRRIHAAGEAGHAPLKPFRRISRRTVEHLGCPT